MSEAKRFGPEHIRRLRGTLSRAAFARKLGVTPLTVYRWELAEGAVESRRPRGRAIDALIACELGGSENGSNTLRAHGDPVPFAARASLRDDAELSASRGAQVHPALWPLFARISRGEFRAAEQELFWLMAAGKLDNAASRALGSVGLACVQRWGRDDLRGAFATLAPHLAEAEAGRLPNDVAVWVHAMAAVIFAGFDGHLFDAGRVNAHVARAERMLSPFGHNEVKAFLRHAEVVAAFNLGEPELIRRALERARDGLYDATEPALRCIAADARANEAMVSGQGSLAARRFGDLAQEANAIGFALVEARSWGFLAGRRLEEAANPEEALALAARAREAGRSASLFSGFWSVFTARVESEALVRLARFSDAGTVLDAGEKILHDLRWPAFQLQPTRGRLCLYTGTGAPARAAGERLLAFDAPLLRGLNRAYAEVILAFADWIEGDAAAGAHRFETALMRAREAGGWMFLERECLAFGVGAKIAAGDLDGAEDWLRQAERVIERLPAAWWTALCRRHRGMLLCARGEAAEGRQHLEAALGTFTLAGDVPEATLTRRALALAAEAMQDPAAHEALVRTEAELARAGMWLPPWLISGALPNEAPAVSVRAPRPSGARTLMVPFQRLSVRGVSPGLLLRELLSVATALVRGNEVSLEELDSSGRPRAVAGSSSPLPHALEHGEVIEFGDGMGRRLRLTLVHPVSSEERSVLEAVTSFAGLALENAALRGFSDHAPDEPHGDVGPEIPGFVAASSSLKQLRADLARLSGSRATVIVTGESGAGKELVARAIHLLSNRKERPYVAFNCASVPRELFEGQLFGYRRGAFTGARADHPGVIRAASGGTLFLDEIGELPLDVQPKLLRFLENGEVFPLGDSRPHQVDVRVVAATHRDLAQLVREGRFREDLFYRLQVVPLRVPPLRERPDDIIPLARHFIAQLTPKDAEPPALAPDALSLLVAYSWPGNVRELRNVIERAMAYAPTPSVLTAEHLRVDL